MDTKGPPSWGPASWPHKALLPSAWWVSWCVLALLLTRAGLALADDPSLYVRLGGEPVVGRVVEQVIDRLVADPAANQSFAKVNLKQLKKKIIEQICNIGGGGCPPPEDDMRKVHAGLNITETEFYRMVEYLRDALDENGVRQREKNELLRLLAPMKRDVVTR